MSHAIFPPSGALQLLLGCSSDILCITAGQAVQEASSSAVRSALAMSASISGASRTLYFTAPSSDRVSVANSTAKGLRARYGCE
jgi:hypothetical protein